MNVTADAARKHIRLLMLVNDVSLRNLIPDELAKGFGFFQAKPSSAFAPCAITPDELGAAWDGGKVHLPLLSFIDGQPFGKPNAGVDRSEEHTSELQSLMRIPYAFFCLKKKKITIQAIQL